MMFQRILFPTDFSHYAQRITECLGEIPGTQEIILLHIVDTKRIAYGEESEGTLLKQAELLLQEQKEYLESLGKTVKTKVRVGIPSREILSASIEENVSLVVMGARGRSLIKDLLLGSVSSDVLRYGKTNLLIMRHKVAEQLKGMVLEKYCDRIFSNILYPTDFSRSAERVLSFLRELPTLGRIILVHAVDRGETREELESSVKEAKRKLNELQKELKDAGLTTEYHVHIGDPSHEINRVAEEEDVSLIAIGSRGKGLIEEIRIGSTAESVVRNAKRPVLVVRA